MCYTIGAKLTEYVKMCSFLIGIAIPIFCHNYSIEFDKNANSFYVIVVTPFSRKVSLATIGVCVFCALASVGALFYFEQQKGDFYERDRFDKPNKSKHTIQ